MSRLIKNPCKFVVYIWKRGEKFLYIGSSVNGAYSRLNSHHVIKFPDMLKTDIIEVLGCNSERQCRRLEMSLINKHNPKFNKRKSLGFERISWKGNWGHLESVEKQEEEI